MPSAGTPAIASTRALCREQPPQPDATSKGKPKPVPSDLPPPPKHAAEADGADKGRDEGSARAPKEDARPAAEEAAPAKEDAPKAKAAKVSFVFDEWLLRL